MHELLEAKRTWAKLGSNGVAPPNGVQVGARTFPGLIVSAVDETVHLMRALLGRLAELPALEVSAAALSRRLDSGVPEGGWASFLQSVADAVGEAVSARDSHRDFDDLLDHLAVQLKDTESRSPWQADAAGVELAVQVETARLRREAVTVPRLGRLKNEMHAQLDNVTRELLEFRYNNAHRQDEHERHASDLSKEISEIKGRTDELIKLCAEQETRLMIDSLTGCHSRYAYERRLEEEFQRWRRHSQPLTFSLWDIDLFKRVNDSYGHKAGDRLLCGVAQVFTQNKRAEDFLARIGGEEFALLLPLTTLDAATGVADKLRRVVEAAAFRHHGEPVQITISAGLTDFRAGDDPTTVYERADRALYQAKQQGRNHCVAA